MTSAAHAAFRKGGWEPCGPSESTKRKGSSKRKRRRSGNVLVLSLLLMFVMFAVLALANDLGYLCLMRTRLQRSADCAALAGAATLYPVDASLESQWYYVSPDPYGARQEAQHYVRSNPAGTANALDVLLNLENDASGDIVVGRLHFPPDKTEALDRYFDPPNSVQVTIPMTASHMNGSVALFFARVMGIMNADTQATATATVWYPALLPFATSTSNWQNVIEGATQDNFAYTPGSGDFGITTGSDGLPEAVMFPGPWDGEGLPPGNFGLLEIGPEGAVVETIRRQVDAGPSVDDMAVHGGELASGEVISGRTGIKSSSKHAFLGGWADGRTFGGMLGRPRMLPLYESATGNGSNATYTLARFVAVRLIALKIDTRWRTSHEDTEGNEITAIAVQPLGDSDDLVQVQLTR